MGDKFSRREILGSILKIGAGVVVIPATFSSFGCGPALILRAGVPRLTGVAWGALRTRPALATASTRLAARRSAGVFQPRASTFTVKGLVGATEWYLTPKLSHSAIRRIEQEHPRLIVEDETGNRFDTPYGVYEDIGVIQPCVQDKPLFLFENPSSESQYIRELNVGEEVGVFSLAHTSGWYYVQTTDREKGWVSGFCLEELPPAKYYN